MKKFNYYQTLAQKNWAKFLSTRNEIYLDRAISFREKVEEMIRAKNIC
jgi:hypothetical protein